MDYRPKVISSLIITISEHQEGVSGLMKSKSLFGVRADTFYDLCPPYARWLGPYMAKREWKPANGAGSNRSDAGPWLALGCILTLYGLLASPYANSATLLLIIGFGAIFFAFPDRAMLLVMPSLLPLINIDLGIGSMSLLRCALLGAFLGQLLRGKLLHFINAARYSLVFGWAILIFALVVSAVLNGMSDSDWSTTVLIFISRGLLFVLTIAACVDRRSYQDLVLGWVYFGVLSAAAAGYMLGQGWTALSIRTDLTGYKIGSLESIAISWMMVSVFTVNSLWASLSLAYRTKSYVINFGLLCICAVMFLPIIMSGRRQAILALGLSTTLWLVLFIHDRKTLIFSAVPIIIGTLILSSSGMAHEFFNGRESIQDEFQGRGTHRLDIYLGGIDAFASAPIFGHGPGTYMEQLKLYRSGTHAASHNTLIGVAAQSGAFGLLGLLILFSGILASWCRLEKISRNSIHRPRRMMLATAGVALAGMMTSNLLEYQGYLLTIAMWPAMLGALGRRRHKRLLLLHDSKPSAPRSGFQLQGNKS